MKVTIRIERTFVTIAASVEPAPGQEGPTANRTVFRGTRKQLVALIDDARRARRVLNGAER